ncbi:hypothetical protein [Agrococcus sp. TSP3-2-1]|uniref:hypothetical protein n=1 Tax=Agrococcus sp. TSP3-2-1 TaxID=2804583 RepID=UPI003CF83A9E
MNDAHRLARHLSNALATRPEMSEDAAGPSWAAAIEQAIGALDWLGIAHFSTGAPDGEGWVDGDELHWCSVQADEPSGYTLRVDLDLPGDHTVLLPLLTELSRRRPEAMAVVGDAFVLLRFADDEASALAMELATICAAVLEPRPGDVIDAAIWERSEQPRGFPRIGDLPTATAMYA